MTIQTFNCYYMCHNCDYTSKQHCAPQLLVELSLIISSKRGTTTTNVATEDATTSTDTFTKWEDLKNAAKDLINAKIRQQYVTTSTTTSASHSVQQYTSMVDQWKAYQEQQQQKERNTSHTNGHTHLPSRYSNNRQPGTSKNEATSKWSIAELETRLKSIRDGKKVSETLLNLDDKVAQEIDDNDQNLDSMGHVRRISIHDIFEQQKQKVVNTTTDTTNSMHMQYREWENISVISHLMQAVLFEDGQMIMNNESNRNDSGTVISEKKMPYSVMSYYPIPRPFQIRYSFRSKKDVVVYHRPGIVLKPKLNPLDGDSSTSHSSALIGQWYRKDSSAIYTIPQVHVTNEYSYDSMISSEATQKATSQRKHLMLLKVSNPTLGPIRLRLLLNKSTSSTVSYYNNESLHWNDTVSDVNETIRTASFRNVLLDPLHHVTTDELSILLIGPQSASSNDVAPMIELQSMEDSILLDYPSTNPSSHTTTSSSSMNRGSNDRNAIPDSIKQWGHAITDLPNSQSDGKMDDVHRNDNTLRFFAQNASTAWYELSVLDPMIDHLKPGANVKKYPSSSASSFGIPMVLEIDVGNGSWESSLIPVQKENDTVRLDLAVVSVYQGN